VVLEDVLKGAVGIVPEASVAASSVYFAAQALVDHALSALPTIIQSNQLRTSYALFLSAVWKKSDATWLRSM
jgi:hypothetical protein